MTYKGIGKRLFAWMLAHGNKSYERAIAERKRTLFAGIDGEVLELGAGTGVNLQYYPPGIHWTGIEPNPFMHAYLRAAAQTANIEVQLLGLHGDKIDIADETIDAAVSTLVLCSVPNPAATIAEIRRVLKPGGKFYFIEHVAAPSGSGLIKLQRFVKPLWKIIGDGCNTDRDTNRLIEQAGFSNVSYESFRAQLPIVSPHVAGIAVK